jgi:hypothetical protein
MLAIPGNGWSERGNEAVRWKMQRKKERVALTEWDDWSVIEPRCTEQTGTRMSLERRGGML